MRRRRCPRCPRNLWNIPRLRILNSNLWFFGADGCCDSGYVFYSCSSTGMMVWSVNTGISRIRIIWNMASIELTRLYLEIIPHESIN